ncbi:TetR/AcrR family transcriptional regulator C-terminal domain-containing protein [Myxococcus landrumensis]|uniref:TetR/AcrR family transcriptional regulator C-terminal domain-containing protein n=1 Tax=Myxococcus landrumensis TaxID=2813577 RepID=A0ABX7NHY8_9BACT|nr:TetR/AcrR family transcriptional regulator C-terminal domain-containing protein [Myxococcus landrumus]QSQ17119.1 TetR/AcrR family transcriptional regulator C-terminal domain-containing protein [Myxococcus landrumus]
MPMGVGRESLLHEQLEMRRKVRERGRSEEAVVCGEVHLEASQVPGEVEQPQVHRAVVEGGGDRALPKAHHLGERLARGHVPPLEGALAVARRERGEGSRAKANPIPSGRVDARELVGEPSRAPGNVRSLEVRERGLDVASGQQGLPDIQPRLQGPGFLRHRLDQVLLSRPDRVEVSRQHQVVHADLVELEQSLGVLMAAGFSLRDAVSSFQVVFAFVVGHSVTSYLPTRSDEDSSPAYERLSEADFPRMRALARLEDRRDVEEEFEFGLETMFTGLTASLPPKRGKPRSASP